LPGTGRHGGWASPPNNLVDGALISAMIFAKGTMLPQIQTYLRQTTPGRVRLSDLGATICERLVQVGAERKTMTIYLARTEEERGLATHLINRMYSWRGYGADHHLPSGPRSVTFTACLDEDVVGTLTLTVDAAEGLAVDKTFGAELDAFRAAPELRGCELTKFAFDPEVKSQAALATLFNAIVLYGTQQYDCTDLFIEVNPRHIRFYERMLGFNKVGALTDNESVAAPAQLMRLRVAEIRPQIEQHGGQSCKGARSLYPFFMSKQEEWATLARIAMAERMSPRMAGSPTVMSGFEQVDKLAA
jgi:hypothetical protein